MAEMKITQNNHSKYYVLRLFYSLIEELLTAKNSD